MKSFEKMHPELVREWSDKNGDLKPGDVSYGSNQKVWWIGNCGHVWKASVKNRSNGSSCPYCSGNRVLYGVNDFGSCQPEIAAEWFEKNYPMAPSDFTVFRWRYSFRRSIPRLSLPIQSRIRDRGADGKMQRTGCALMPVFV